MFISKTKLERIEKDIKNLEDRVLNISYVVNAILNHLELRQKPRTFGCARDGAAILEPKPKPCPCCGEIKRAD